MLSERDRQTMAAWIAGCRACPGTLPAGVELVQGRLVRVVGLAGLPDRGPVYLKAMGFPRRRDRLRYLLRPLPAVHEARLLRFLASKGMSCPQVVLAHGERRRGLPYLSLLITAALTPDRRPLHLPEMAAVAAELARLGLFHPDLNRGNFVPVANGAVAVLDLQSARLRRAPLAVDLRLRMAAKLVAESALQAPAAPGVGWLALADMTPACQAVVEAGLVPSGIETRLQSMVWHLWRRFLVGRIRRCLEESTEFRRKRRWNGVLHERRQTMSGGTWRRGGRELRQLWIGDRAREVLHGVPPVLGALFQNSPWLPGMHKVYIPDPEMAQQFATIAHDLLEGYAQFQRIRRGDEDAPPSLK